MPGIEFPFVLLSRVLGRVFDSEPPSWLTDPLQKKSGGATSVVSWAIQFICTWYYVQGFLYPLEAFSAAISLFVAFGILLFCLRQRVIEKYGKRDHSFIHSYYGVPEAWLNLFPLVCSIMVHMQAGNSFFCLIPNQ